MAKVLMGFYGFGLETAREVIAELQDLSLQSLAGYRVARAVPNPTPPTIF